MTEEGSRNDREETGPTEDWSSTNNRMEVLRQAEELSPLGSIDKNGREY